MITLSADVLHRSTAAAFSLRNIQTENSSKEIPSHLLLLPLRVDSVLTVAGCRTNQLILILPNQLKGVSVANLFSLLPTNIFFFFLIKNSTTTQHVLSPEELIWRSDSSSLVGTDAPLCTIKRKKSSLVALFTHSNKNNSQILRQ